MFDPFEEIRRMQERMSRLIEEFDRFIYARESIPVDIIDEGEKFRVIADLPGFNKEDIEIYIEDGGLVVKAERREEKEEEGKNYIRQERSYGRIYRRITLPEEIDEEKISAKYNNGILEIILPKIGREKRKVIKIE